MADPVALLDTLRPLREPPLPPSLLPVFVMIMAGIGVVFVVVWVVMLARLHRHRVQREAEAELAATRTLAPSERLAAQARLLRRLARTLSGSSVIRETEDAWLLRLDQIFATSFFTEGNGRVFGAALYQAPGSVDVNALDHALGRLFAKVRR